MAVIDAIKKMRMNYFRELFNFRLMKTLFKKVY